MLAYCLRPYNKQWLTSSQEPTSWVTLCRGIAQAQVKFNLLPGLTLRELCKQIFVSLLNVVQHSSTKDQVQWDLCKQLSKIRIPPRNFTLSSKLFRIIFRWDQVVLLDCNWHHYNVFYQNRGNRLSQKLSWGSALTLPTSNNLPWQYNIPENGCYIGNSKRSNKVGKLWSFLRNLRFTASVFYMTLPFHSITGSIPTLEWFSNLTI